MLRKPRHVNFRADSRGNAPRHAPTCRHVLATCRAIPPHAATCHGLLVALGVGLGLDAFLSAHLTIRRGTSRYDTTRHGMLWHVTARLVARLHMFFGTSPHVAAHRSMPRVVGRGKG